MAVQFYSILVLSLICLHLNRFTRADDSLTCLENISTKDKTAIATIMETCKKKLNLDSIPKPDEVEKNGFDDKVKKL